MAPKRPQTIESLAEAGRVVPLNKDMYSDLARLIEQTVRRAKMATHPDVFVVRLIDDNPMLDCFYYPGKGIGISDVILNQLTPREVAAFVGHELGHYKNELQENKRNGEQEEPGLGVVASPLIFAGGIASAIYYMNKGMNERDEPLHALRGRAEASSRRSFMKAGVGAAAAAAAAVPIVRTIATHNAREAGNERLSEGWADVVGVELGQDPGAFASGLRKMKKYYADRGIDISPPGDPHGSIDERIRRLEMQAETQKTRHGAER